MKSFNVLGFMATAAVAAPGIFEGCNDYTYDPPKCPQCPYKPGHHSARDLVGRGGYGGYGYDHYEHGYGEDQCYRECPRENRVCREYNEEYSQQKFELSFQEEVSCASDFRYQLDVKIEQCSSEYVGQECLNVNYLDGYGYKRGDYISESNLGIYLEQQELYNPREFNYNNYCNGNSCSVPTEYLPNYEDLCDEEIYLAVGNNECYDNYEFEEEQYRQSTKYVKVKVSCNSEYHEEESCKDYCCCP